MTTSAPTRSSNDSSPGQTHSLWKWGAGAAAVGSALAGAAFINIQRTRRAERANPPLGEFVTIDGVRLHYLEAGQGPVVVLVHGNGTMIEDWIVSGVFDALARTHRVIAFDRPGFGHSERPRSRIWTTAAQAELVAKALGELNVEKAVVVGHSFGTQVVVALALDHRARVGGIVLLAGYYYPSLRPDVMLASQPAVPLVGDVMRYTVSPLLGAALTPQANAKIFRPAPVPAALIEEFPLEMTLRPSQIRAEAAEAALMISGGAGLMERYDALDLPVAIVAGSGDALVDTANQSQRLHLALPQSSFAAVEGSGHMVHHTGLAEVLRAVSGLQPER